MTKGPRATRVAVALVHNDTSQIVIVECLDWPAYPARTAHEPFWFSDPVVAKYARQSHSVTVLLCSFSYVRLVTITICDNRPCRGMARRPDLRSVSPGCSDPLRWMASDRFLRDQLDIGLVQASSWSDLNCDSRRNLLQER